MTWLWEIGKLYRDSVENLRENMFLRSKFCVCVSILDSATDLSGCSQSGSLSSGPKVKSEYCREAHWSQSHSRLLSKYQASNLNEI